jgi:hypothetical protein
LPDATFLAVAATLFIALILALALLVFLRKRGGRNPIGVSNVSQSQYPA